MEVVAPPGDLARQIQAAIEEVDPEGAERYTHRRERGNEGTLSTDRQVSDYFRAVCVAVASERVAQLLRQNAIRVPTVRSTPQPSGRSEPSGGQRGRLAGLTHCNQ